jgi:tetratricopeptide (TPR) repeat protein
VAYANSLSGAFVLDDQSTIVDNPQIRQLSDLGAVSSPERDTAIAGRPAVNLSFAINYAIHGLDVRGYHAGNIAIHIACALLFFGIVWRTLSLPRVTAPLRAHAVNLAFAAALIWVVHPLNSEAVDYLTERTESLMALFYLSTLYASIRRRPWLAIAACALGMATKESMATAPLMVVLYDRVFVYDSFGQVFRARLGLYAGLACAWIVLGVLMASGPRAAVGGFSTGVTVWTYLLNQSQIITHYLRLSVWPRGLVVFYGWPLMLTLKDVLPYALFITALLIGTLVALWRWPALGFLGAWFFVTLAPTSSIIPVATEVGAERRMYLPLLAVVLVAVTAAAWVWNVLTRRWPAVEGRPGAIAAGLVLLAIAGPLTAANLARNREYATPVSLARSVVERRPTAVAHHYLAEQLVLAGQTDEALPHLRAAVVGGDSRARYLLGIQLFNAGKLPEAMEQLYAFVATAGLPYRLVPHWLEPPRAEVINARLILARAASMQGGWSRAIEQARLVLAAVPNHRAARLFLADALFAQQKYKESGVEYNEYLKLAPPDIHVLTNLGIVEIVDGKLDEAIKYFRQAVALDPKDANAHRVLGMALLDTGDAEGAVEQARQSAALKPNDPGIQDLLNRATAAAAARRR